MLPKINRVNSTLINTIFKEGKYITSGLLTLRFLIDKENPINRISFVAPKNTFKKNSERILFRRKGYFLIKEFMSNLPKGFVGVFIFNPISKKNLIFKKENKEISMKNLEKDIYSLISRIKN